MYYGFVVSLVLAGVAAAILYETLRQSREPIVFTADPSILRVQNALETPPDRVVGYAAFDTVNHKVIAKVVTDIEVRSGATVTAGGLLFTALQDGWVVAYNDETLEELWRFNVGTPLKGSPVTYAIGPTQYVAVQTSGRHLHPVNWDKLQNSSYLFVFALN